MHARSGLKFRTVCASCNSALGKLDESLASLSRQVKALLSADAKGFSLPGPASVAIDPSAIARAVAGHIFLASFGSSATEQPIDLVVQINQTRIRICFRRKSPLCRQSR